MSRGVLLIGHGSRDWAGNEQFLALARELAAELSPLEPAFLGHAAPSIAQGVARLGARGVTEVCVEPLFLFSAGHMQDDIPRELKAGAHPGMTFRIGQPMGAEPELIRIAAAQIQPEDHVLLIGVVPTGGFREVARLLQRETGCAGVEPIFLAGGGAVPAEPAPGARQVAVLPYLLFPGVLMKQVQALTAGWQARRPDAAFRLTGAGGLGAHPEFARLVRRRLHDLYNH